MRRNGATDEGCNDARVATKSILSVILIALVGLTITLSMGFVIGEADPISGVIYRGFPLAFLKFPPKWDPVQAWQVRWLVLAFDTLVWTLPAIVFLAFRLVRRIARRQQWTAEGRCAGCGYELRGSDSARCSECGLRREQQNPDTLSQPM